MKRRNFFKVLGIGIGGCIVFKPDLAQSEKVAEEVPESIPIKIRNEPPTKNLFPTNVKCGLYYKDILLVEGTSIKRHSIDRMIGFGAFQHKPNSEFVIAYPKIETMTLVGALITSIDNLNKIFCKDTSCTLVMTQLESQISIDVIIMEFSITTEILKLKLALVTEATVTPL